MAHVKLAAVMMKGGAVLVPITTEDFCGDKKVDHKVCSKNNGNARIVGYYEGWAPNRPCNVFWPEDIPIGLYTHINFAFATIDPKTFKVAPSSKTDVDLYKRLMLHKQKDPGLKVFIAIGGWTFNDPGPTATTFSDLAASVPRQKTFIDSLLSFMSTYGFDGLDLDWEYPVAEDRSGREVDFDNFPKFMSRLKQALTSASKGLTITLPASYWYLQHFDLVNLEKSVDWFNIMSYDLHGTWDKGNKWTGNVLNPHTNLTEIDAALDLLWRNDVDPTKVVMGVAFYGRAFSATSESCLEPGCTYESGGQKGKCSREVGILLNSEIDDMVTANAGSVTLYKKEAAKVATWGNQWISYDDEETLQMKSEYAQTLCLGGLMVWAISHDTKDRKYNKALAKVTNRKISMAQPMEDGSDNAYDYINVPHSQCKWTNCGESCPAGWVHVARSDSGARKNELMTDGTGCGGSGSHSFCCPTSDSRPTCGWYKHNNGKCSNECPSGTVEIGSNSKYCNKVQTYQAACCTTDTKSMTLYTKGQWGSYPDCNSDQGCPSDKKTLLFESSGGTGGSVCKANWTTIWTHEAYFESRKYCYDTSDKKETFSDCRWYNNIGFSPSGAPKKFCRSGCPSDRVRVGMDPNSEDCYNEGGGGAKSQCCIASFSEQVEVENPLIEDYRDAMEEYVKDPTCKNPDTFVPRGLHSISKRDEKYTTKRAQALLLALIVQSGSNALRDIMGEIWNKAMSKYKNLQFPELRNYLTDLDAYGTEGPIRLASSIICSPAYWNNIASKAEEEKLVCIDAICNEDDCPDLEPLERRTESLVHIHRHNHYHRDHRANHIERGLVKRVGAARDYTFNVPGGGSITITLPSYNQIRDYPIDDPALDEAVDFVNRGDCGNSRISHFVIPIGELFQVEHTFDGNVMTLFMEDAANGRLRSGAIAQTAAVPATFFRQVRTLPMDVSTGAPPLPGGADYVRLFDRVMESLGSRTNEAYFVLAHRDINRVKGHLMRGKHPISKKNIRRKAASFTLNDTVNLLVTMRACVGMLRYLDHTGTPNVNRRLTDVVNNVGAQWNHGQAVWNAANPNNRVFVGDFWSEWVQDYYPAIILHVETYVQYAIDQMRQYWGVSTDARAPAVLNILASLESQLGTLTINTAGMN
ncbi:unnamed protein product [Alternaria alternata]